MIDIVTPPQLKTLAEAVRTKGAALYYVGGSVRNALIGLPASDLDVTGRLLQDEVQALCDGLGIPCVKMSTALGTLHINCGSIIAEYTPFRTESYAPGGAHRPESVSFGVSMVEDARRRDFTVNALYRDVLSGQIADPLGGMADLEKRTLRLCAPDTLRSDALRILRLVRFHAELSFAPDGEALKEAAANAPLLADIVPERKREELDKILIADAKYGGGTVRITPDDLPPTAGEAKNVLDALMLLDRIGAWEFLIPEITKGRNEEQNKLYHRYTVMEHIFHTVASAPRDPLLRLTMLMHDIGKSACFAQYGNYHLHDVIGEPLAFGILTGLRYPNETVRTVCALVREHMFDTGGSAKENTVRRHFAALGRENTARLIAVREADVHGCGLDTGFAAEKWRAVFSKMLTDGTPFGENELKITGREIMEATGLPAGKRIGEVKKELLHLCIPEPKNNTPERLKALACRTEAAHKRPETP